MNTKNKNNEQEKSILDKNNNKNVLNGDRIIKKNILISQKIKNNIIKKCERYINKHNSKYSDIFSKINEFNNNGKKTIVYFIDNFYPSVDGVLVAMENYVNYMKNYYNIVVCAPRHKKRDIRFDKYFVLFADAVYIKSQGYDLAFPKLDKRFKNFISLLKIDLIHIQSPFNMGDYGLKLAKKRHIPCFITFHSQYKRDFYKAVKNKFLSNLLTKIILKVYQKSTVVLTMNNFSKNLLKEYGLKKDVQIIPNATNLLCKTFEKQFENKVLNKYHINVNKYKLIYIGRLIVLKNIYFILEVLNELNNYNVDYEFIFMGDGPERKKIENYCKNNKLESCVKLIGNILDEDEKSVIIKNSNILFFPSDYDTDGIVKIECACYNIPSLCLSNTGASSNIKDNHNGFVEKKDVKTCAQRINYLVKNADFVKKIGKIANLELYKTWNDVCKDLKELYEKYLY